MENPNDAGWITEGYGHFINFEGIQHVRLSGLAEVMIYYKDRIEPIRVWLGSEEEIKKLFDALRVYHSKR
jgi:hypothetical protein